MNTYSRSIEINAPVDRVWSVLSDVERWPEWTASMRSVRRLDEGPLAVGSRVRIRQPGLAPLEYRVTELEPHRGFTWVTRPPGVTVTAHHVIEPTASGARVTLTVEYTGPLGAAVAWLSRGVNDRYLRMEAEGLRARSEAAAV